MSPKKPVRRNRWNAEDRQPAIDGLGICVVCCAVLTGRKTRFCSKACANIHHGWEMTEKYRSDAEERIRQKARTKAARTFTEPRPCSDCGASPDDRQIQRHHESYGESLAIVWLCKPCHEIRDKARRLAEIAHSVGNVLAIGFGDD